MATLYFDGGFSEGVGTYSFILYNSVITKGRGVVPDCRDSVTAEYHALFLGLEKAIDLGIYNIVILGDSRNVLHQLTGQQKVRKTHNLHREAMRLLELMPQWSIEWIPSQKNPSHDLDG